MSDPEIDVTNKFAIASHRDDFVFLRVLPQRISQDDALVLAAYIVAMVCDDEKWLKVLAAVEAA